MPWVAMGIGGMVVLLGITMLRGRHLSANFAIHIADRLGNPNHISVKGFFVFGLAFATVTGQSGTVVTTAHIRTKPRVLYGFLNGTAANGITCPPCYKITCSV